MCRDWKMSVTIYSNVRDNHWSGQKPSMEKNTVGNEPYIKKATVSGGFFVLWKRNCNKPKTK